MSLAQNEHIPKWITFYEYLARGECQPGLPQADCDTYPFASRLLFPLVWFGSVGFDFIFRMMVLFIPSYLLYKISDNLAVPALYQMSPLSLLLITNALVAQFLALVLLIVAIMLRKSWFNWIAALASITIQRFAIFLFGMLLVAWYAANRFNPDIKTMKLLMFPLFGILLIFATNINLPFASLYQTSWLSMLLFSGNLLLLFNNQVGDRLVVILTMLIMLFLVFGTMLYSQGIELFGSNPVLSFNPTFHRLYEVFDLFLLIGLAYTTKKGG